MSEIIQSLDKNVNATYQPKKRRYRKWPRTVFYHRKNLAVHLAPEISDRLGLVADQYYTEQRLEGNSLVITFYPRRAEA